MTVTYITYFQNTHMTLINHMFKINHIISINNNVNNLYNQSIEVEYLLHVMASAADNVNFQLHTYHKSSSMCIIQTLGSFPMSKN